MPRRYLQGLRRCRNHFCDLLQPASRHLLDVRQLRQFAGLCLQALRAGNRGSIERRRDDSEDQGSGNNRSPARDVC
jgi:hypothetical protein